MDFDCNTSYVIALTAEGILILWNFSTLQRRATLDLKSKDACLAVSKRQPFALVASGASLHYASLQDIESSNFKLQLIELTNLYLDEITAISLSPNDNRLATIVVHRQLSSNDPTLTEESSYLRVYAMTTAGGRPLVGEHLHNILLQERPWLLDVTADGAYAVVCGDSGRPVKLDCELGTQMADGADLGMRWSADGLMLTSLAKPALALRADGNKATAVVSIAGDCLCIADQRGTVSLVEIEPNGEPTAAERLYSAHLGDVGLLKVSQDKRWLLSYSSQDRSIVAWRIRQKKKPKVEEKPAEMKAET
jgi:WD40 repeat protein